MPFRFSLRWLLAGTVYAAIAAAAFSQQAGIYGDILWAVSFAAVGYALLLAAYSRGEQQARAAGFAVLAAGFLGCLYYVPERLPTGRWVTSWAAGTQAQVQYYSPPVIPPPAVPATPLTPAPAYAPSAYGQPAPPQPVYPVPVPFVTVAYSGVNYELGTRAANALATLVCGLVGSLLGLAAFRRTGREPAEAC